jgi:hypothetical protein
MIDAWTLAKIAIAIAITIAIFVAIDYSTRKHLDDHNKRGDKS